LWPNHAWRHTFKAVGRSVGISDKVLDDICGHAPASEGQGYGRASLEDMAAAIRKLPRYGSGTSRPKGLRRPQRHYKAHQGTKRASGRVTAEQRLADEGRC